MSESNHPHHPQSQTPNQGSLQDMPIGSLLLWILREQMQGELHIEAEGYRQWLYFARGFPVASRGGPPENFLGWVLREKGFIDDDVYLRSLQKMAEERKPQGQILLAMGSLRPEQLQQALVLQLQRKIIRLFRVETGSFTIYPTPALAVQDVAPGALDPYTLVSNGTRQGYTEQRLERFLYPYRDSMIKRKNDQLSERFLEKMGLDEVEKAALQLLDRWTTVHQFVASQYLDRFPSLILLAQLIMADLLFVQAYSEDAVAKSRKRPTEPTPPTQSTQGVTVETSIDDGYDLLADLGPDQEITSHSPSVSVSVELAVDPRKADDTANRPRRRAEVRLNVKEERIETIEAPLVSYHATDTHEVESIGAKQNQSSPPWPENPPVVPWDFQAEEADLLLDSLEELPANTDTMTELPASYRTPLPQVMVYPPTPQPNSVPSQPELASTIPAPQVRAVTPPQPSQPVILTPPPPSSSSSQSPSVVAVPPAQVHAEASFEHTGISARFAAISPPPLVKGTASSPSNKSSVLTPPPPSRTSKSDVLTPPPPSQSIKNSVLTPPPPSLPSSGNQAIIMGPPPSTASSGPVIAPSSGNQAIIMGPPPTSEGNVSRARSTPAQPTAIIAPPPSVPSAGSPISMRPGSTSGGTTPPPPTMAPRATVATAGGPATTAPRPVMNQSTRIERVGPTNAERSTSNTAATATARPNPAPSATAGSGPKPAAVPGTSRSSAPSPTAQPVRPTATASSDNSNLTEEEKKHERQIRSKRREIESGCNHYDLLMVAKYAPANDVRESYYKLSRTFHPDRVAGTPLAHLREDLEMIFSHLNEAYSTLSNKALRTEYDDQLRDPEAAKAKERAPMAAQAEIHYTKSLVFLKQRNFKSAEEEIRWAVQLLEDEGDYQATLAWAIYNNTEREKLEKARLARHHIELAAQHNADPEKLHFYWGMIEKGEEQHEEALKHFNEALRHNPRNVDATREMRNIKVVLRQDREPKQEEEKPKKSGWSFFKK